MTLLLTDPRFVRHETGHHPERPMRLHRIWSKIEGHGLAAQCRRTPFEALTPEQIGTVHERHVIELAREVAESGGGHLDADTVLSRESYDVARLAAGACAAAVDAVLTGDDPRALCLVRPPGHHATPDRSMGFCLFNNIALAARQARVKHGLTRVLIVDWDVHHGNGTQDIFWANGDVHFLSIHRYGHGFYPGTGAADETGTGPGLGKIRNEPIPFGTPRKEFLARFQDAVGDFADRARPELILLSAGFDAHVRDPIGSLGLETEDFGDMTRFLLQVAQAHSKGRLVSCLEGGYNLDALAESVQIHLEELLHHT
jgi:acetoin utilization deacetylase AcuC-like enzyme